MTDVFIGYKREDKAKVQQIADALTSLGLVVAWDQKIPPGQTWASWIGAQIASAKVVVVCWSKQTEEPKAAAWVLDEAKAAQQRDKPLLPVIIEACNVPLGWGQLQASDLSDWQGATDHPEWEDFVTELQRQVRLTGSLPSAPAAVLTPSPKHEASSRPKAEPPKGKTGPWAAFLQRRWQALVVGALALVGVGIIGVYGVRVIQCPTTMPEVTDDWDVDRVIEARGAWVPERLGPKPPCGFLDSYFIVTEHDPNAAINAQPRGVGGFGPGAVVRATGWREDGTVEVTLVHGRSAVSLPTGAINADHLTAVGSEWLRRFATISNTLFSQATAVHQGMFPFDCPYAVVQTCTLIWNASSVYNGGGAWYLNWQNDVFGNPFDPDSRIQLPEEMIGGYLLVTGTGMPVAPGTILRLESLEFTPATYEQRFRLRMYSGHSQTRTDTFTEANSYLDFTYTTFLGTTWDPAFAALADDVFEQADVASGYVTYSFQCEHADGRCNWRALNPPLGMPDPYAVPYVDPYGDPSYYTEPAAPAAEAYDYPVPPPDDYLAAPATTPAPAPAPY